MKRAELIQKMIEHGKTIGMLAEDFYKWMDGLDTHKQGFGKLKDREGGYCCLGVEQKVRIGTVEPCFMPSFEYSRAYGVVYLSEGLEAQGPDSPDGGYSFSHLNDDKQMTFAELKPLLFASAFLYADPLEAD